MKTTTSIASLVLAMSAFTCILSAQWVGEWKFDEVSGNTAADLSPSANHGTLNNFGSTQWGPGKIGNALTFDGFDDYVEINGNARVFDGLGSPFSIAYWIKAPVQRDKRVYSEGNQTAAVGFGALFTLGSDLGSNARVWFRNDAQGVKLTLNSNAVVYDDTWHHVAFVHVSGQFTIYVDGVLDNTGTYGAGAPGFGTYTTDRIGIGAVLRSSASHFLTGSLDDMRIYKFALSVADVGLVMQGAPLLPPRSSIGEYGAGCGNGPFDLAGSGSAMIGGPGIQLLMQNGIPNAAAFLMIGGTIAPVDLTPLGFTGCTAYPSNFFAIGLGVLDAAGTAPPATIPVPNDPSLFSAQFNFQAAALDIATISLEFSDAVVTSLGN